MNHSKIIVLLLAAASLPFATAGTPTSPELTDASGDVPDAHLDITKAWVTSDADSVTFHVQVRSFEEPVVAGDFRALYRLEFALATLPAAAIEGQIFLADAPVGVAFSAGPGRTGVGSVFHGGGNFFGNLSVDGNVVVFDVSRSYSPTGVFSQRATLDSGAIVSGLTIRTAAGESVVIGATPAAESVFGPAWRAVDTAGPAGSFVVP